MTRRRPTPRERYVITSVRRSDAVPFNGRRRPRWDWIIKVDPRSTDDDVVLPRVYNRPLRTRLGIEQELVLNWDSPQRRIKCDSWPAALRTLRTIHSASTPRTATVSSRPRPAAEIAQLLATAQMTAQWPGQGV